MGNTQTDDLISLTFHFKESRLKMNPLASPCLHVALTAREPLDGFYKIWYWGVLLKFVNTFA
jgi:hypothetical protein